MLKLIVILTILTVFCLANQGSTDDTYPQIVLNANQRHNTPGLLSSITTDITNSEQPRHSNENIDDTVGSNVVYLSHVPVIHRRSTSGEQITGGGSGERSGNHTVLRSSLFQENVIVNDQTVNHAYDTRMDSPVYMNRFILFHDEFMATCCHIINDYFGWGATCFQVGALAITSIYGVQAENKRSIVLSLQAGGVVCSMMKQYAEKTLVNYERRARNDRRLYVGQQPPHTLPATIHHTSLREDNDNRSDHSNSNTSTY